MKHRKAIYFDKNGDRQSIRAEILNEDPSSIVELRNYRLLDVTEEFEMCIVDHSLNHKKSHFRLLKKENSSRYYEFYDSERHDNKIIEIHEVLETNKKQINFVFKDFRIYPSPQNLSSFKTISNYSFYDETVKETEKGKPFARYDLYGLDNQLSVSPNRPEIIIEVVDENFNDKDLFNFLIKKSSINSLVVIYYYVNEESLYNKYFIEDNKFKFRISCYIENGVFYYCGIPLIIPSHILQESIDNEYRYFNYVEQMIIKPIKKGSRINISEIKKQYKF